MKVCILTHTFPRYKGDKISSIFMAQLAQSLVENGNEVWVLTPYTPAFRISKTDYKIRTYKYIFPDTLHKLGYSETLSNDMSLPVVMLFLSPFMYLFGFIALLNLVRNEKIDLINAHWILPNGFMACLVSVVTGVPVVSTLPGSDVYMARKNWLFKQLAIFAALKSKWITSNSPQLLADLASITKVDIAKKTTTIPYGIGSDKFKPDNKAGVETRKQLGFSESDKIVLGVGRLVEKKGFRYLIRAAQELLRNDKNTWFVIVGDGEEREFLLSEAKKWRVEHRFKFVGNISYTEMNGYYNMADIFILPSIRDKVGNLDDQSVAVMDAMVCGKPAITTDFPGYRSIINDGVDGYLVRAEDVAGIASTIKRLIADKSLRKKIGTQGRDNMIKNFTWKAIGKRYTKLFTQLTSTNE